MDTKIQHIMRKPVLIGNDASFLDALRKMICEKTNSLLIINKKGALVGKIQALDLLRQIKPGYMDTDNGAIAAHFANEEIFREACEKTKDQPLEMFMDKDPHTIGPQASLLEAAVTAIGYKDARIPVVDDRHLPVGLVTRTELKQIIGKVLNLKECIVGETAMPHIVTGDIEPLTRFLLPIDGSETGKRVVTFAGCLAAVLADRVKDITLLNVTGEGFLKRHFADVAKRRVKGQIIESELFQHSKKQYISNTVQPMLAEAEDILKEHGVKSPVNQKIVDGDPAKQILRVADDGCFSTIIMGRRGLSPVKEIFLGSVTASLLHNPFQAAVYIVGNKVPESAACPVPRILIPVDGSSYAQAAVQEAAALAGHYKADMTNITLLRVIDIAKYPEKTVEPDEEAEVILNKARQILLDAGIDEQKVVTLTHYGKPAESILEISVEKDVNLIMVGRRGRSAVQELFMGSVSSAILHRCVGPTVAII